MMQRRNQTNFKKSSNGSSTNSSRRRKASKVNGKRSGKSSRGGRTATIFNAIASILIIGLIVVDFVILPHRHSKSKKANQPTTTLGISGNHKLRHLQQQQQQQKLETLKPLNHSHFHSQSHKKFGTNYNASALHSKLIDKYNKTQWSGQVINVPKQRNFPNSKIVYLLHIHKSGGTSMCLLSGLNNLSQSGANCNVQVDQRCCGHGDTLEAQQQFAASSKYDIVASEGRMYEAMDLEHYYYVVILRHSQRRYFSHWKHARRTALVNLELRKQMGVEESHLVAAGGSTAHGILKKLQAQFPHAQPRLTEGQRHQADGITHMQDLVRESKAQRKAAREEKLRQMQAFAQHLQEQHVHDNSWNIDKAKNQTLPPQNNNPNEQAQQQQQKQQQQQERRPIELALQDFTMDGNSKMHMPVRRRRLAAVQQPNTTQLLQRRRRRRLLGHDEANGDELFNHLQQHPAEDPSLSAEQLQEPPIIGTNFQEWWERQPDNWNVRQLCGTRCIGIPKYQISLDDWAYTLERLLQFDSVLLLEEYQEGVDRMAVALGWTKTNLQEAMDLEAQRKLQLHDDHRKPGVMASAHAKVPEEQHTEAEMQSNWDPLMTILDDALYDIGKRMEDFKKTSSKTSHQLTPEELAPLADLDNLPDEINGYFELYMDEQGQHRYNCQNECCAERCSIW